MGLTWWNVALKLFRSQLHELTKTGNNSLRFLSLKSGVKKDPYSNITVMEELFNLP